MEHIEQVLQTKSDEICKIKTLQTKYVETKLEEHYNDFMSYILPLLEFKKSNLPPKYFHDQDITQISKFYSDEYKHVQKLIANASNKELGTRETMIEIEKIKLKITFETTKLKKIMNETYEKNKILYEICENEIAFLKKKINNTKILKLYYLENEYGGVDYENKNNNDEFDEINKKIIELNNKLDNVQFGVAGFGGGAGFGVAGFGGGVAFGGGAGKEKENELMVNILSEICLFYNKKLTMNYGY